MAFNILCIQHVEKQRKKKEGHRGGGQGRAGLVSHGQQIPRIKAKSFIKIPRFTMEDAQDDEPMRQCNGAARLAEHDEGSICGRNSKITVTSSQIQQ